jgi:tight adherence protein B
MDFIAYSILGKFGVSLSIALIIFMVVFRYSREVFDWVEDKLENNRQYVIQKLDLLFLNFSEDKITYFLLGISFGLGALVLSLFLIWGHFLLGLFMAILFIFLGLKAPVWIMNILVLRKQNTYQNQMVDGLQLLANGLRAGQSLVQSLGMVVDELPPPISLEFKRILDQNRVGLPLEECLEELVKRVPLEDNEMFVTSVNILHETGGNLPETFSTIVEIIRERVRLKQKISTYVAQSLSQGIIICCMPAAIGAIYYASDPQTMGHILTHPLGIIALIIAIGLNALGGYAIYKIVNIKV